jgi:hypothetical protein
VAQIVWGEARQIWGQLRWRVGEERRIGMSERVSLIRCKVEAKIIVL